MPSLLPLDDYTGAALIGLLLSGIVYGITLLQVYSYFVDHPETDGKVLKIFVTLLLIIDTLHVALVMHCVYYYTITNFGDYLTLLKAVWSLDAQVVVADVLALLVQGFYARRIYILSLNRNWWLPAVIILLSVGMTVCSLGYTVNGFRYQYFSEAYIVVPWGISALVSEMLCDFSIMVGMIYYLGKNAHFAGTKRAISKLVTYTVNSGILTALCTVVTLATYLSNKQSMIYVPSFFILARLYSCSFMSILNSRGTIRGVMYSGPNTVQEPITFGNGAVIGAQIRRAAQTATDGGDSTCVGSKGGIEMV